MKIGELSTLNVKLSTIWRNYDRVGHKPDVIVAFRFYSNEVFVRFNNRSRRVMTISVFPWSSV